MILTLAACLPREPVVRTTEPIGLEAVGVGEDPMILSAVKVCDADASIWTFEATTDAWTGGGWVWMTVDGIYVEKHRIPSVAAARDGSSDELLLALPVAVDWRDDEGTAFACGAAPSGQIFVTAPDLRPTDCRAWGDPEAFAAVAGAQSDCPVTL